MTITELIKELDVAREAIGDVDVVVYDDGVNRSASTYHPHNGEFCLIGGVLVL